MTNSSSLVFQLTDIPDIWMSKRLNRDLNIVLLLQRLEQSKPDHPGMPDDQVDYLWAGPQPEYVKLPQLSKVAI